VTAEKVIAAHDAQKAAQEALDAAQVEFRAAVQEALAERSMTVKQIADATGLTTWRIYQIRDGRR